MAEKVSQMQSLVNYVKTKKKFIRKIRKMAKVVKQRQHTVNMNILILLKEQAVDKDTSLVAAKKKVEKTLKGIEQYRKFRHKSFLLFED